MTWIKALGEEGDAQSFFQFCVCFVIFFFWKREVMGMMNLWHVCWVKSFKRVKWRFAKMMMEVGAEPLRAKTMDGG